MPKSELLRRMDEAQQSSLLFDRDVYDPTETSTPNTPEGVSVKAVQDGVLIEVDFTVDTAHLHPRFQAFIVYAKPIGSEASDGSGTEVGRFSDNDWTWQPERGGYTGWFISLSAISNTGRESAKSPWKQAIISTYYDDFSDYGGLAVSNLDSLNWLEIAGFNSNEIWTGDGTYETNPIYIKEGDSSIKLTASSVSLKTATRDVSIDLSEDGRFGDNDYICIAIYIDSVANLDSVAIKFVTGGGVGSYDYIWQETDVSLGWNLLAVKKSELSTTGSPDWTDVTGIQVGLLRASGTVNAYFDDWRIVKADPDDVTTFNDTGSAWEFKQGTWHIYPGNRSGEPSYDFSLGQIQGGNLTNYFATRNNVQLPHGRVSAGVMLKGVNGRAGILFRVADTPAPVRVIVAEDITATDTATVSV